MYLRRNMGLSRAPPARLIATYLADGQPGPLADLHARTLHSRRHAPHASVDRRAPQAAPGGPPGLDPRRLGASGRPRQGLGCRSRQRSRRGQPVPVHRPRRAHFGEPPPTGPEAFAGILPRCRARLPFRQRLRVRQLPSGRARGKATSDRTHQVAPAAHQRKRPGGEQEQQCGPQGVGPLAHCGVCAERSDRFHREILAGYLNYYRPCHFAHVETDAGGKRRNIYRPAGIRTPYEALNELLEV